jgi:DNA-binding CsgD family transcriptional regulator
MRIDDEMLLGRIYDAALDRTRWPDVLDCLSRILGYRGGALVHVQVKSLDVTLLGTSGLDAATTDRLPAFLSDPDDNPFTKHMPFFRPGDTISRQAVLDDESFERRRIYTDYFQPQDLYHDATAALLIKPEESVGMFLSRHRSAGAMENHEAEFLRRWIPHLERAVLINRELGINQAGNSLLNELLERISCGVALIRSDGKILAANKAAERIEDSEDGLAFRGGTIVATHRQDGGRLEAAIAAAVKGGTGGSLAIERQSCASPFQVFTIPLSPAIRASWPGMPAAAVLIVDPEIITDVPAQALAKLYSLSPMEAAVALEIVKGTGRPAVAAKFGISENTLKTHLGKVFGKTGTSGQVELARLLGLSAALWSGAGD